MSYTLRVTFSGLCLWVFHPARRAACVLLPDARMLSRRPPTGPDAWQHEDGTEPSPHVGYVHFDLARLHRPDAPSHELRDVPPGEVTSRLDGREIVLLSLPPEEDGELPFPVPGFDARDAPMPYRMPNLRDIAPAAMLRPGAIDGGHLPSLLARTFVRGGELADEVTSGPWVVSSAMQGTKKRKVQGLFAGRMVWERDIPEAPLEIALPRLGEPVDADTPRFVLYPAVNGSQKFIELKIANLCAVNPLEWPGLSREEVREDKDFKWYFRLLQPVPDSRVPTDPDKPFAGQLGGSEFPYPRLSHREPGTRGDPGCICGCIAEEFALPQTAAPRPVAGETQSTPGTPPASA